MTTDNLSGIFEDLHQEKTVVLRGQLSGIAVEIGERQRLTLALTGSLREELQDLGSTILNLTRPEHPDLYLKERVTLEEQRRQLTGELRAEQLAVWRDVQDLRREQRTLEQELVSTGQQHRRLEELSRAPGPL